MAGISDCTRSFSRWQKLMAAKTRISVFAAACLSAVCEMVLTLAARDPVPPV